MGERMTLGDSMMERERTGLGVMTRAKWAAERFEADKAKLGGALAEAGQLTGREQSKLFGGHRSAAYLARLCQELASDGRATERLVPTAGRPVRLLVASVSL